MKLPITSVLLSAFLLASCGDGGGSFGSGLNPFGWFKSSNRGKTLDARDLPRLPEDPRGLVDQIITLKVERAPGGAIIRATGLPPTQGWWDGELKPMNGEQPVNGALVYRFVIAPPPGFEPVSTPRSRMVVVARFVSDKKLEGVRRIIVQGARNQMVSRR